MHSIIDNYSKSEALVSLFDIVYKKKFFMANDVRQYNIVEEHAGFHIKNMIVEEYTVLSIKNNER